MLDIVLIILAVATYQFVGLLFAVWVFGEGEWRNHGEPLLNFWTWPIGLITVPVHRMKVRRRNRRKTQRKRM